MMAIKVAYKKKGDIVNVWETHGKELQKEIIREQHKTLHKKEHLDFCVREGITEGNPCASYTYEEPDNLFKILDDYDENDTFLYGYDIILKHARPVAPKLKTVFLAAHLNGEHIGTSFGMWGQDSNKHVVCMCLSTYFANESRETWECFLFVVKTNFLSIDAKDKVIIAGEWSCLIHCKLLSTLSLHGTMLTLSPVHILTDDSKGFSGVFDAVFDNADKFKCKIHKGNNLAPHQERHQRRQDCL
jgi:hypothetical protein